jgi:predicted PurR-regulated permease PerM
MDLQSQPIRFSFPLKLLTAALITVLTIWMLVAVEHILTPFIAAIITAYLFNPLVSRLHYASRLPRAVWIAILYVLAFFLLYLSITTFWPVIVAQSTALVNDAPRLIAALTDFFANNRRLQIGELTVDITPVEAQLVSFVSEAAAWFSGNVPRLVFSALESVIYLLVYLIITFYLLLQAHQLKMWTVTLIPAGYRDEIGALGRQIDRIFSAYIRGQLLLIVIMSVLLYIPLSILQIPYALVIAVASGILEILPIIGPWSAAAIAMTAAMFSAAPPFGLTHLALAAAIGIIYFVLRQIEDHFIIPNVMGPLVRLHPAVVIFAILAGGALAGAFGLFISIPVAAVIRILLSYLYRKLTDQAEPGSPATPEAAVADAPAVSSDTAA